MDSIIYTQSDFANLVNTDMIEIKKILDIIRPEDIDDITYLYSNLELIEQNQETKKIIDNKLLAGQTSVKWYKYNYSNIIVKDKLIEKLRDPEKWYKRDIKNTEIVKNDISCIVDDDGVYTCKIFIQDGYNNVQQGLNYTRIEKIRSVIVKIDVENCWIEFRCPDNKCTLITQIIATKLGLSDIYEVAILRKYHNDINEFKNSLQDGFYMHYTAMPSQPLDLTQEDSIALAELVKTIDRYIKDKNTDGLVERLSAINFDAEDISIISILLAGIDSMGMKIKNNSDKDMSEQSLYAILKDYIMESSSFIKFRTIKDGPSYTIVVGLKSNNIVFRTSVTEEVITYIRNKIL